MRFILRSGPILALLAASVALVPRAASAGCSVVEADRDNNGVLDVRVAGDSAKQAALAEINNDGSWAASVDCNADGDYADSVDVVATGAGPVESYFIELMGNDTVVVRMNDDLVGAARSVMIALAGVLNEVTFDSQGHGVLGGSNLGIELVGSTRFERVTLDFAGSAVADSALILRGDLNNDGDKLTYYGPASVTASSVDVSLDMGRGSNRVDWYEGGGLASGSNQLVQLFTSELTTDIDAVYLYGASFVDGGSQALMDVRLQAGDDRFSGTFDSAQFGVGAASTAEYVVHAGPGLDRVTVSNAASAGSAATVDGTAEFRLEGFNQPDNLYFDWDGITGGGTFRLRMNAGDASDTLLAAVRTDPTAANSLDIAVNADSEGDITLVGDTAYLAVVDSGASNAGPAGAAIVDGGLDGIDYCAFFGTVPHFALNCETVSH